MDEAMKEAALLFASHGIPVLPLHTPSDKGCSCSDGPNCDRPGKHPRWHAKDLRGGLSDATINPRLIDRWWTRWPEANVAIVTGARSGILVVDVDGPEGVSSIEQAVGPDVFQRTLTVRTGNGGCHLYFKHPGGVVPNSVKKLFPGVDVRGDGGYVVVPPSKHASGAVYQWGHVHSIDALPLAPKALKVAAEDAPTNGSNGARLKSSEWGTVINEGSRDQELTRRAGKLLANDVPPSIVLKTLLEYNGEFCNPPLPEEDVVRIVQSISGREAKKRVRQEESQRRETVEEQSQEEFPLLSFSETLRRYGGFEVDWIIRDWLPKSTCGLVVAPPSTYKTWILADLATAAVGARKFLGSEDVHSHGPVIIIQQEDFMPALVDRICKILGAPRPTVAADGTITVQSYRTDLPIFFHDQRMLHFGKKPSVRGLARQIETIRPSLVLIDPLYSAVDMRDFMAEAAQQLMVLKDLRDAYGTGFLLAHHTAKPKIGAEGGRQRDEAWGSQFLNAWLETGWQLRADLNNENCVAVTRHFKVAANPSALLLEFNIDDEMDTYAVTARNMDEIENDMREKARAALGKGSIRSHDDLARALNLSGKGTASALMRELGAFKPKNGDFYRLPAEYEVEYSPDE